MLADSLKNNFRSQWYDSEQTVANNSQVVEQHTLPLLMRYERYASVYQIESLVYESFVAHIDFHHSYHMLHKWFQGHPRTWEQCVLHDMRIRYQTTLKSSTNVPALSFSFIQQHQLEDTTGSHNNQNMSIIFLSFCRKGGIKFSLEYVALITGTG